MLFDVKTLGFVTLCLGLHNGIIKATLNFGRVEEGYVVMFATVNSEVSGLINVTFKGNLFLL